MKKIQTFVLALVCAAGSLLAAEDCPKGYTMPKAEGNKIIFSDDFSNGLKGWREWRGKPAGWRIVPGAGDNGSPALVYENKNPHAGPSLMLRNVPTVAGRTYHVSALCGLENISDLNTPLKSLRLHVMCAFHYDKNGKETGSTYPSVAMKGKSNREWGPVTMEFTAPPKTVRSAISLCCYWRKLSGKATFDNFVVEQRGSLAAILYPVLPKKFILAKDGKMLFRILDFADHPESQLKFWLKLNGKEYTAPVSGSMVRIQTEKISKPGAYPATVCLLDEKTHTILGTAKYTFRVPAKESLPKGFTTVDELGRTKVDGKDFLPIGIFCSASLKTSDVVRIREGGFNCIFPYMSAAMMLDGKKATMEERLRKSLDVLDREKMKIAFIIKEQIYGGFRKFDSVKGSLEVGEYLAKTFRRHPAILGWYITDENLLGDMPKVCRFRQMISAADPYHPVLTLTNVADNHVHFAQTGDTLLIDKYPIYNEKSRDMKGIRVHMESARDNARIGTWFVPQTFHWGAYMKGQWKTLRYPTEKEMRSMVLLAMNCGSKGYAFYSYHPIFNRQEQEDPGSSKWFWPQVCRTAKLLKELEAFHFTDDVTALSAKTEGKSRVDVKLYKANGKECVVITADGPGKVTASFRLPGKTVLKSRYGNTVCQKDGSYLFTGKDIDSDVLMP